MITTGTNVQKYQNTKINKLIKWIVLTTIFIISVQLIPELAAISKNVDIGLLIG